MPALFTVSPETYEWLHRWTPFVVQAVPLLSHRQRVMRWMGLTSLPVAIAAWLLLTAPSVLDGLACAAYGLQTAWCGLLCWRLVVHQQKADEPEVGAASDKPYCDDCKLHWSLQDHHCEILGICVHRDNRQVYWLFLTSALYNCAGVWAALCSRGCRWLWDGVLSVLVAGKLPEKLPAMGVAQLGDVLVGLTALFTFSLTFMFWKQQRTFMLLERVLRQAAADPHWLSSVDNRAKLESCRAQAMEVYKPAVVDRIQAELLPEQCAWQSVKAM